MAEYKGKIAKAYYNPKNGGRYAFCMDDDNWYSVGKIKPEHKDGTDITDGDEVKFEYEVNGNYRNVSPGTLKARKGEPTEKPKSTYKKGGAKSGGEDWGARQKYWDDKEVRDIATQQMISYQAAFNSATAVVNVALSNDLVKIGGKAGVKLEALDALITETAEDIYRKYQSVPDRYEDLMSGNEESQVADMPEDTVGQEESDNQIDAEDNEDW